MRFNPFHVIHESVTTTSANRPGFCYVIVGFSWFGAGPNLTDLSMKNLPASFSSPSIELNKIVQGLHTVDHLVEGRTTFFK